MTKLIKSRLSVRIIIAMILGAVAGVLLRDKAAAFGEVGKLVIQMIKVVAIPLLFLTVVRSVAENSLGWRDGGRLVFFTVFNGALALVIGLTLSNLLRPGEHLGIDITSTASHLGAAPGEGMRLDWAKTLESYVPKSIVSPFSENSVIPLVILALLFALALRKAAQEPGLKEAMLTTKKVLDLLHRSVEVALTWIVQLIPVAVFFVVAKSVGQYGFDPVKGLLMYVTVVLLGLFVHVMIVHQLELKFLAKMSLRKFWRQAKDPIVYAAGANSSLATLPLTLRALENLKVSPKAASLGACVGTNMNNDGIILYEAMAMLFVAQAHGIHLGLGEQILTSLLCLIAAMGVAGIPEAGFVSLSIVLSTVHLPVEILPLILTVDWIIARGRSVVNVLSDMVISILLDDQYDT